MIFLDIIIKKKYKLGKKSDLIYRFNRYNKKVILLNY